MSKDAADADSYSYSSDSSYSSEEGADNAAKPKASAKPKAAAKPKNDAMTSNGSGSSTDAKHLDFASRIAEVEKKMQTLHETENQQKQVLLQVQEQYCARALALETHQQALAKMTATLQNLHRDIPVALPMHDETSEGAKGQHPQKEEGLFE